MDSIVCARCIVYPIGSLLKGGVSTRGETLGKEFNLERSNFFFFFWGGTGSQTRFAQGELLSFFYDEVKYSDSVLTFDCVCVCVCARARVRACVYWCVCVCVWEREREVGWLTLFNDNFSMSEIESNRCCEHWWWLWTHCPQVCLHMMAVFWEVLLDGHSDICILVTCTIFCCFARKLLF